MSAPFPALRWRSPKEKERAFRALYALGARRDARIIPVDVSWAKLDHSPNATLICAERNMGDLTIFFRREDDLDAKRTLVNSVAHLISYAQRHLIKGAS